MALPEKNGGLYDTSGKGGTAAAPAVSLFAGVIRGVCGGVWDGSEDGAQIEYMFWRRNAPGRGLRLYHGVLDGIGNRPRFL